MILATGPIPSGVLRSQVAPDPGNAPREGFDDLLPEQTPVAEKVDPDTASPISAIEPTASEETDVEDAEDADALLSECAVPACSFPLVTRSQYPVSPPPVSGEDAPECSAAIVRQVGTPSNAALETVQTVAPVEVSSVETLTETSEVAGPLLQSGNPAPETSPQVDGAEQPTIKSLVPGPTEDEDNSQVPREEGIGKGSPRRIQAGVKVEEAVFKPRPVPDSLGKGTDEATEEAAPSGSPDLTKADTPETMTSGDRPRLRLPTRAHSDLHLDQDLPRDLPGQTTRTEASERPDPSADVARPATASGSAPPIRSPLVQAALQRILPPLGEPGETLIRLNPRGLGVIEVVVHEDRNGSLDVSLRVQNPVVLDALRQEREAVVQAIHMAQGGIGGGLSMDLFQSGSGQRGGGQPSGAARNREGALGPGSGDSEMNDTAAAPILRPDHVNIVT